MQLSNMDEKKMYHIQSNIIKIEEIKTHRAVTIDLVDKLAILCKEKAPMIVLFFAPPYYPAVSSRNNPLIKEVVVEMEKYAHYNHKITFENQNYFGDFRFKLCRLAVSTGFNEFACRQYAIMG